MPRIERSVPGGASPDRHVWTPRHDIVIERELSRGRFECERGPFARYERRIERGRDGLVEIIDYRLATGATVPFGPLIRRTLRDRPPRGAVPWWAPPDTFDAPAATAIAVLCALSVLTGYLGTLLTQTITFASDQFGTGTGSQGAALASVRVGVIGALVITTLADRRGRRRFLLGSLVAGCLATAAGAVAPNLPTLAVSQTAVRGLVTAAAVIIAVVAAEEVPAGSRAYSLSLIAMSGALGVGMSLWVLPLADVGDGGWRILFALALLGLPVLRVLAPHLPESRRFAAGSPPTPSDAMAPRPRRGIASGHARRFWLLAASALLLNLFAAPASQFQNEFLRDERAFSAARISLFAILTNTPGAIGIIIGGRLADLRGRRAVGAIAVIGGSVATLLVRYVDGWEMWAASVVGAIVGAATIPALGVYGPELFPTSMRNRVNTVISLLGVVGSTVGLLVAGRLADEWGGFGPALTLLALGPLAMALLVLVAYPETARKELEELNPEDARPARGLGPPPPVP
jgi:MFS family permease